MTVRMLPMIPKAAIGTSTGPYMKSSNSFSPSAIFKENIVFYFALKLQWYMSSFKLTTDLFNSHPPLRESELVIYIRFDNVSGSHDFS